MRPPLALCAAAPRPAPLPLLARLFSFPASQLSIRAVLLSHATRTPRLYLSSLTWQNTNQKHLKPNPSQPTPSLRLCFGKPTTASEISPFPACWWHCAAAAFSHQRPFVGHLVLRPAPAPLHIPSAALARVMHLFGALAGVSPNTATKPAHRSSNPIDGSMMTVPRAILRAAAAPIAPRSCRPFSSWGASAQRSLGLLSTAAFLFGRRCELWTFIPTRAPQKKLHQKNPETQFFPPTLR
jgi:hypothetical protein